VASPMVAPAAACDPRTTEGKRRKK
jgi:hypothetical protein